jgi:PH (Pleckstrin Homology) domain-containing protein
VTAPARLRMSRTALVPVALLFVCVIPLATARPWTLVFLLLPLAAAAYVLRVGVDVGDDGLTVHSAVAARRVGWEELAGIRIGRRRELWLVTTHGTEMRLPVLRVGDLPRLAALSGGRIPAAEPAP